MFFIYRSLVAVVNKSQPQEQYIFELFILYFQLLSLLGRFFYLNTVFFFFFMRYFNITIISQYSCGSHNQPSDFFIY
jgi:hypothetical protein